MLREAGLLTSERRASWFYSRAVTAALARLSQVPAVEAGAAGDRETTTSEHPHRSRDDSVAGRKA
ncbi:hypothetical protein A5789_08065 [Nocardia sp. 852002-51101_SCH5132738]|nr:hypothetical protein A5789_08065 [Nocardia sp. 852002-51101_SCH5132738]OBF84855.1 hypothetical protein A9X06_14330 [Mycobacterium sp. 852002-51759_SCH5129042]